MGYLQSVEKLCICRPSHLSFYLPPLVKISKTPEKSQVSTLFTELSDCIQTIRPSVWPSVDDLEKHTAYGIATCYMYQTNSYITLLWNLILKQKYLEILTFWSPYAIILATFWFKTDRGTISTSHCLSSGKKKSKLQLFRFNSDVNNIEKAYHSFAETLRKVDYRISPISP